MASFDEWWESIPSVEQDIFDKINSLSYGRYDVYGDNRFISSVQDALFNNDISKEDKHDAYEECEAILWYDYGLAFEDMVDWDDYRAWYG